MANTASRLSANGSLTISGSFDEVSFNPTSNVQVNLISYSQDFTQTSQWAALSGLSVTSPGEIAPDRTQTAQLFTGNGVTTGYLNTTFPWVAGRTYTFSCYFKAGTLSVVSILLYGIYFGTTGTGATGCDFNLNTITTTPFGEATATIQSVGNGWFRCSITTQAFNTRPIGDIGCQAIRMSAASGTLYAWGYQIEESNAATTYVATGTNAVILANNTNKLVTLSTNNSIFFTKGEIDEVTYNPNNIGPTKNLFQNSQDFNQQFAWLIANGTITKNYALAPDNTQTASLFSATGQYPVIYYYPPGDFSGYKLVEPGKFYTHSMFVKYVNQSRCTLVNESSPVGGFMIFDLLTGTLQVSVNGSITRATITPFPNGWWRISVTYLIPSTSYASNPNEFYWQPQWRLGNYDGTNYNGSQTLVWGAQLEEGNTASTYVATGFPKNLLLFTNELTTPSTYYWYRENCTITKNATISPDRNYNGFLLSSTINGGSNTGFFQKTLYNLPINTNYTYSVYLKQGTSPTTFLNFYNVSPFSELVGTITWPAIYGNAPTVSYSGGATRLASTITDAGNGWWRFSLSMNNGSSSGLVWRVYTTTNGVTNVIGNSVYVWGPQLEFGLTPTTLIRNDGNFINTLPLANTNMVMKTTNTGNTFIKSVYDEVFTGGLNMVTNGLTLYMDAAKLDSYPETGTRWNDIGAGANFNATFTATPNHVGGQYIAFDATYYANTGKTPTQLGMYNQPFTAMALFRVPDVALSVPGGTNDHMVLGTATTLTQQGMHFGTRNNNFFMGFYAADVYGTATVVPNTWYLVTWVWNNTAPYYTIYVNGVLNATGGGNTPFLGTTNLLIGSSAVGTHRSDVNMVAIYNRALSQAEVTQNYNAFRGPFGI